MIERGYAKLLKILEGFRLLNSEIGNDLLNLR